MVGEMAATAVAKSSGVVMVYSMHCTESSKFSFCGTVFLRVHGCMYAATYEFHAQFAL
jgi:hypothetical protein